MKPKEPREWWLSPSSFQSSPKTDIMPQDGNKDWIYVIEKSAYDAVLARNQRLRASLKLNCGFPDDLILEIESRTNEIIE